MPCIVAGIRFPQPRSATEELIRSRVLERGPGDIEREGVDTMEDEGVG